MFYPTPCGEPCVCSHNAKQEELLSIIGKYDGLVVRSGVQVDEDLIAAADNMRIVGRAGTGGSFGGRFF